MAIRYVSDAEDAGYRRRRRGKGFSYLDAAGLTTLRDRHARAGRSGLVLEFPGKNGLPHCIAVDDRWLARLVRACQDLPGQRLFQYLDAEGGRCDLTSADVNEYLREIGGGDFTAKDFRTWAATVQAACRLCAIGCPGSQTAARRNIAGAVRAVSQALRNTAAVCRKSYIHPAVLEEYAAGALDLAAARPTSPRGLDADERAVLAWLRRRNRTGLAAAAAA